MVKSLHLLSNNIVKTTKYSIAKHGEISRSSITQHGEILDLVLQNKSVECKSQTPSPDPKDLCVLFMI